MSNCECNLSNEERTKARELNRMQINKLMSERLRTLRMRAGKTQKEIADMLCVNRSTYSYYESGLISLPTDLLVRLSRFYDVSADMILGRSPD